MTEIKNGDKVRIHYTGTLTDGTRFDSSEGRDPMEIKVGAGQVITGLDTQLPGMTEGEKKTLTVDCADAYGPINPALRQPVPRDSLPDDLEIEKGMRLQMQTSEGQVLPVMVVEIGEDEVMLDVNHPLAGQDLVFEIEIVSVN